MSLSRHTAALGAPLSLPLQRHLPTSLVLACIHAQFDGSGLLAPLVGTDPNANCSSALSDRNPVRVAVEFVLFIPQKPRSRSAEWADLLAILSNSRLAN